MRLPLPFARLSLGVGLACCAVAGRAEADDCVPSAGLSTCVDADNLWPHAGAGPWLSFGSTDTTQPGRASFALVTSYLSRPIGLRVSSADPEGTVVYAVDNAVDASFLFAVGVVDRLELTLAAPVTLYQDGAGLSDVIGTDDELPRSALRHVRPGVAVKLLERPRTGAQRGPALTGRFELALPAGDSRAFARASTVVGAPSVAFDDIIGRFRFGAEASARLRGASQLGGATVDSQLGLALGGSYAILPDGLLSAGVEGYALYTFADQQPPLKERDAFTNGPALVPAEWMVSATSAPFFGGDVSFSLAGGGALPLADASAITTPRYRFDLAVRYAPLGLDADADGVANRDDRCPLVAEDRDGFQDEDGCPDPDNDKDGILDAKDRCRDAAETVDGFQDDDGCPDLDDDNDGVADEADQCRNDPEDRDGFEDADGCPDLDNDRDGIPDAKDLCPTGTEDKDGYKDEDGCPDPDNDLDGIPDAVDACPDEAEDKDGFEDADGCPEVDNDRDGVLDAKDACPTQAETLDGNADDDGCPEPGARSLVAFAGDRVVIERPGAFARGGAALSKDLERQVGIAARLAASRAPLQSIIVEAFADRPGDVSDRARDLAARRAETIKAALVSAGLPAAKITAASGELEAKRPAGSPAFEITVVQERVKKRN